MYRLCLKRRVELAVAASKGRKLTACLDRRYDRIGSLKRCGDLGITLGTMEKDGLVNLPLIQNQLIETGVTYSFIQGHLIEPSIIV